MRKLPPLAAVRVFEAAARHGNFTRAANELGMTQAAVSYQVKMLEERLGSPMFARSGRGIVLTELGRRISPQVTAAFDTLGDAFNAARAESESVLTISAPTTFSMNWLAGRLGAFQLARPGLAVRLNTSDEIADLNGGDIDVAIRGAEEPWPGLCSHFLMRMVFTPLASPALLAQHPPIREPADLLDMPRVSPDDSWWRLWFDSALGQSLAQTAIPAGVGFDSQVQMGHAAIAGHGLAVLSPTMWQPAIAAGQLVQPLPQVARYRNSFWLVYPENKRGLGKVRAFRDWLLAEVRAAAGDDPLGALVPPEGFPEAA